MENNLSTSVISWLRAGAEANAGIQLFSQYSNNTRLAALIRIDPVRYLPVLKEKLCQMAGVTYTEQVEPPKRAFRDDFPFLRDENCPVELKILATDKITAYHKYTSAHNQLFHCMSLDECYNRGREVIDNFIENRAIYDELNHYRECGMVLGKHRIFGHLNRVRELKKLSIVELLKMQTQLKNTIWRINSEIGKNNKPNLLTERQHRLREKTILLSEVDKLIETYGRQ